MGILREILGLEKDLDDVAHDKLEQMIVEFKRLNDNMNHLRIVLENIRRRKKDGKEIDPSVRENFFATLSAVKSELIHEFKLEEEVKREEKYEQRGEKRKPRGFNIQRITIETRRQHEEYSIGSVNCTLPIPGLANKQVGLWRGNNKIQNIWGIVVASHQGLTQVWTPSKGLEQVYGTAVVYDKYFNLHIYWHGKTVIIRIIEE